MRCPISTLIPFAVVGDRWRDEPWWTSGATLRLLLSEYAKYVAAEVRVRLADIGIDLMPEASDQPTAGAAPAGDGAGQLSHVRLGHSPISAKPEANSLSSVNGKFRAAPLGMRRERAQFKVSEFPFFRTIVLSQVNAVGDHSYRSLRDGPRRGVRTDRDCLDVSESHQIAFQSFSGNAGLPSVLSEMAFTR